MTRGRSEVSTCPGGSTAADVGAGSTPARVRCRRGRGRMTRPRVVVLYVLLVAVWSSTWLAIKLGLEDWPPLLSAGVRFTLAGLLLLAIQAKRGGTLRSDPRLVAVLALGQFALTYGLLYWGEQYVASGLAAVLFGVAPLYTALLGAVAL